MMGETERQRERERERDDREGTGSGAGDAIGTEVNARERRIVRHGRREGRAPVVAEVVVAQVQALQPQLAVMEQSAEEAGAGQPQVVAAQEKPLDLWVRRHVGGDFCHVVWEQTLADAVDLGGALQERGQVVRRCQSVSLAASQKNLGHLMIIIACQQVCASRDPACARAESHRRCIQERSCMQCRVGGGHR